MNLSKLDSKELIRESRHCLQMGGDSSVNRALTCMNIVATRYQANPNDNESAKYGCEVMRQMGNIYMSYSIDYQAAYKNLMQAKRLAERINDNSLLANVYLSLSNLYQINTTDKNFERMRARTLESMQKAFQYANLAGDSTSLSMALMNMILGSTDQPDMKQLLIDTLGEYNSLAPTERTSPDEATQLALKGIQAYWKGDIDTTVQYMNQSKDRQNKDYRGLFPERKIYTIDLLIIELLIEHKLYPQALDVAKSTLQSTIEKRHKDYELSMYSHIADIYRDLGKTDSMEYYYNKFLQSRINLEKGSKLYTVDTMDLLYEIDTKNEQVQEMTLKQERDRMHRTILYCGIVLLVVILCAMIYIHLHLKKSHRQLYQSNLQADMLQKREKKLRRELEKEQENLREQNLHLTELVAQLSQSTDATNLSDPSHLGATFPGSSKDREVSGRTLQSHGSIQYDYNQEVHKTETQDTSEETEDLLPVYSSIISVMENDPDIYSPDYSLDKLAGSVHIHHRIVSKAINELHGCNFRQLLNEYRIKEVCRLMHMPEYDAYTVEYFVETVGFRSRTSFVSLFKKSTGLTPSVYWKMAKTDRSRVP